MSWRTALVAVCFGWLVAACVTESTQVLVRLDTDVPADRRLMVTATVHGANMNSRAIAHAWLRGDAGPVPGVDAGAVRFPASFGIIPNAGERDATVNLVIDATLLPRSVGETTLGFRRIARFRFTPGQTTVLPIFLSMSCASPTTGCTSVPAAQCSVSVRCEESGRTCGDRGECIDPVTDPHPFMPGDLDGSVLPSLDAGHGDGSNPDVPTDPCGGCPSRAHAASMCVSSICVLQCESGFGNCDGDDATGCESPLDAPEHCGTCGNTCPSGQLCLAGNCVPNCTGGTTLCDRSCADLQNSSTNCGACGVVCASGTQCIGGSCLPICTGTTALCGTTCLEIQSDPAHCGDCSTVCPGGANASPACTGGHCDVACNGGFANCNGSSGDGCETFIAGDVANCGACGANCAPSNASPSCNGGLCGIAGCAGGWADVDGAATNGCECGLDANGASCAGPSPVGPVAVGGTTTIGGNLVPASQSDWFSVAFAPGGHPHVTLTGNPGGHFLRMQGNCSAGLECAGPVTEWEFFDTAAVHTTRNVAAPTQMLVEVGSTGQTTCGNYSVVISN